MNEIIKKYSDGFFGALISQYKFELKSEIASAGFFMMEYESENYVIKIEKYHRELYPSVYSLSDQDNEINLFNLLGFLKQNDSQAPKSAFFRKEKNLKECYKKQLSHISGIIYDSLFLLNDFFSEDQYERNSRKFHKYWKDKHPELYSKL